MTPATAVVMTAPDDAAGPALRPAGALTARDLWLWLVAGRLRHALDTGQDQRRVALVETVLDGPGELLADPFAVDPDAPPEAPRARVYAVDMADPAHLAAVWAARRRAGLPTPPDAAPGKGFSEHAVMVAAVALPAAEAA